MTTALMLMVVVVLINLLGLIEAVEKVIHYKFKILGCSKCGTFWLALIVLLVEGMPIIEGVTMSIVAAYVALWLELFLAIMAKWYETCYDKIQAASYSEDETCAES